MSQTELFDSSFTDAEGKTWNCVLSTKVLAQFCREENLRLDQVNPETMNFAQMLRLCFLGLQHHQEMVRQDFEDFLGEQLEGAAMDAAQKAVEYAIVNFTLPRLPEARRVKLAQNIRAAEKSAESEDGAE